MSATITLTAPAQTVHTLTLKVLTPLERIKMDVSALVKSVIDSKLFDLTKQREINVWGEAYTKHYLVSLGTNENLIQASLGLAVFLYEVIRPALFANMQNNANAQILLGFEEKIKTMIQSILPESEDVEAFLLSYEDSVDQEVLVYEKLDVIETAFLELMKELSLSAKKVQENAVKSFETLKLKIQEINKKRQTMSKDSNDGIRALNEKVNKTSKMVLDSAKKIKDVANLIQKQSSISEIVIKDCMKLLSEI